jgi:hypothetical protein
VKYFRIGLTIGFLVFALICLIDRCNAEDYIVPNFIGGINVATDSTDLLPNQALNLTNLTFDMPNVATVREGYSYYNATAFNGVESEEVDAITIYNDRIISVVNGWPFANTSHFQWTGDSLVVTNGSDVVYDIGDRDWLYLKSGYGDTVIISGSKYAIESVSSGNDTTITFTTNYSGSTDTVASYIVRKYLGEFDSFYEYDGVLYFLSDDTYAGFPMIFNDTTLQYLAVVDTGQVSSALDLDTSSFLASGDNVVLKSGERKAYIRDSTGFDNFGIQTGDIFFYYYDYKCIRSHDRRGGYIIRDGRFYSKVTAIDTSSIISWIEIEDVFNVPCGQLISETNSWEIRREASVPVVDSNYVGLTDPNKNWFDDVFADKLFTGFYAVTSDSGYGAVKDIFNNDDTTLVLNEGIVATGYYYIMPSLPVSLLASGGGIIDSIYKEQGRYKQLLFHGGQYYAIGTYQNAGLGWRGYPNPFGDMDTIYVPRYNRIWYSHPGYPGYAPRDYYLSLGLNQLTSVLFTIRGRLYIGTTTGIWTSSGTPELVNASGDQIKEQVVSNNGIPDLDNWAKATEEYGYFTNRTGVYRFNGVRAERISWLVDPIIENNYNSRIMMIYKNPNLYVSFTDSNLTLVFDERFTYTYMGLTIIPPTTFDFGMTCAYAHPDSDFIYFGLNGQPGRIYYYPNGEYWDRNSATDSAAIKIEYKSGWQTYAGYWLNKVINEVHFPMLSPDTATISIYSDFSGTADDVVYADSAGRFVYRKNPDNDATGEYFQIAIRDTVYEQIIIGGYKIEWETADQWKK